MDDLLQTDAAAATPVARSGGRNVLQVFWQHRALVLLGVVLGATLGVLNYTQRPPVYLSSAQLLVIKKTSSTSIISDKVNPSDRVMEDYVSTHLFVLRSPVIIQKAVEKRNLAGLKSLQGGNPVGTIQAGLKAEREVNKDAPTGSGSNIINLSYRGTDPGDAETVLAAIIESYKTFLDETYKNTNENTVETIQSAIQRLTDSRKQTQAAYDAFLKNNPALIFSAKGTPFNQEKLTEYQTVVTGTQEKVEDLKNRYRAVELAVVKGESYDHVLVLSKIKVERGAAGAKSNSAAKREALFRLDQDLVHALTDYGPDHPVVLRIRKQIELTKAHFKTLEEEGEREAKAGTEDDPRQSLKRILQSELALETNNLEHARSMLASALKEEGNLREKYNTEAGYRNEIAGTSELLKATMKQMEVISASGGSGGYAASAITPPGMGAKVAPVFWQFLLMGITLGFGLGAGAAYLLDMADKSFRTPEEIRRRLGLALVGHIPFVNKPTAPVKVTDAAGNAVELDPGLATVHSPMSPESEAYRGVRTALFFSTHGERHKVIQVTSPNMGDGKTTLIINLAVSIAQSGRKVLLIDADLRRPRVHRAFGVTGRVGLAEVLTGAAELDEAIQVTAIPNLSVLPCGRRPPNPAELLTSPRFEDALDDLREAYDYVLVDSPPLLAVSDPCIVAPRVDGLLLTIRVAKNGRPAAERARDLLTGLKVNCLGVVVNGVGKQGSMAGYGYDHYKYADEYTTPYTTADHDAHAEHDALADAAHAARLAERAADPAPGTPAPGAETPVPVARLHPVLNGTAKPSTNGHGPHGHGTHPAE